MFTPSGAPGVFDDLFGYAAQGRAAEQVRDATLMQRFLQWFQERKGVFVRVVSELSLMAKVGNKIRTSRTLDSNAYFSTYPIILTLLGPVANNEHCVINVAVAA